MATQKETTWRLPDTLHPAPDFPAGQGFLNTLRFWVDPRGKKYVSRSQNHDRSVSSSDLQEELYWNGFLERGGGSYYRNNAEQLAFARLAKSRQLSIIPILGEWKGELVLPWVEGKDVRELLHHDDVSVNTMVHIVTSTLADLKRAHHPHHRIVFGDRWAKNIHFGHDARVRQLDFDIEITGPQARELEMAQVIYSMIRDAKHTGRMLTALRRVGLKKYLRHHDTRAVTHFLSRYATWYRHKHIDEPVRSDAIEKGVEQVINLM